MEPPKIVLASQSPRRSELLRRLGLEFEIQPATIDESYVGNEMPADHAERLAREKALGAISYLVPVEHTRRARDRIGPDALLVVEQTAVLSEDREHSLEVAGAFAERYLRQANYVNNLRRLGWSDEDLTGRGSARLLDAVIVQGSAEAVVARVREHLDAGADHVCLQPLGHGTEPLEDYRQLAKALL